MARDRWSDEKRAAHDRAALDRAMVDALREILGLRPLYDIGERAEEERKKRCRKK